MFDKIGQGIDHANEERLIRVKRRFPKQLNFMLMARVREGQQECADILFENGRKNIL